MWALFDFLMPGLLGSQKEFNAMYGKAVQVGGVVGVVLAVAGDAPDWGFRGEGCGFGGWVMLAAVQLGRGACAGRLHELPWCQRDQTVAVDVVIYTGSNGCSYVT